MAKAKLTSMSWLFVCAARNPSTAASAAMGIDLVAGGRNKKTKRTAPKSDDVYLKLLVKVRLV